MNSEKKEEIVLTPSISGGTWSYITNKNGNSMRITLDGYGSCTPTNALQEMIDNMSYEAKVKMSKSIDEKKDNYD